MAIPIDLTTGIMPRFWEKIVIKGEENDCWQWTGAKCARGYGKINAGIRGKGSTVLKAHRVSYAICFGKDPGDMEVCHKCNNPECCNPLHLYLGTHAENMRDAAEASLMAKKRGIPNPPNRGGGNGQAKISKGEVGAIHRMRARGASQREIAERFDISQQQVSRILNGRAWGWLKDPEYLQEAARALE